MIWKPGKLAGGTLTVVIGMGLRSLSQALVFLIVARSLGADGFGSFTAVLATAGAFSYFSGLGANILLVRDTARDSNLFQKSWGYTLIAYCLGAPISLLSYVITAWLVLPNSISWTAILVLGFSEIALIPLAGFGVFAYQGHERMSKVSWMQLTPTLTRLGGAVILLAFQRIHATSDLLVLWSWLYFCCALVATVYALRCIKKDLGAPVFFANRGDLLQYVKNSLPFSFSGIAEKFYADADKIMLVRMTSVETAGLYSAGYRFVDLAYIPLQALMSTAAPRYFRSGHSGVAGAVKFSLKIWPLPLLYGIAIGCLIFWCAPALSFLLGPAYNEAISVARWLAWLPLMAAPRMLLHYPLATSGLQHAGMKSLLIGATTNIGLNFILIPLWNWRGAVAATYAAELLMIVIMFFCIRKSWHLKSIDIIKPD